METINYLFEQYSVLELFAYVLICGVAMAFVVGGVVSFIKVVRELIEAEKDDILF